ncbi:MAG: hypothetical protein K1060chlam5_01248 [Candidatus Anoxychlamydiales bacterium]|nr:hypothetical protein [Candidatus Anoxychlamydiales bacterium]
MKEDDVIEPNEIIIDQEKTNEEISDIDPFSRFLARFLDYSIFTIFLVILSKKLPFLNNIFESSEFIPIQFALWIPIEAVCLSYFGYTPGKLLLKIKVRDLYNHKLRFKSSIKRSLSVWFKGLAMGINILNLIALFFSFYKLKTYKITSWDKDEKCKVTHKKNNKYVTIFCVVFIFFTLILQIYTKNI